MSGGQNCAKDSATERTQCGENAAAAPEISQSRQLVLSEHAVEMLKTTEAFFRDLPS